MPNQENFCHQDTGAPRIFLIINPFLVFLCAFVSWWLFSYQEKKQKKFAFITKIWYIYTSKPTKSNGAVAQLGARLNGIQKVVGSTPISSIFFL